MTTVLITGATDGLGRGVAAELSRRGMKVLVHGRDREKVERVAKFASDARRSEVEYEHHPTRRAEDSHTCEILVHVKNHLVKGSAAAAEYAPALDRALDKVAKQLRRTKRELREDKGQRVGKDATLREGLAPIRD